MLNRNLMGCPVILHNSGMVDGDVGGALFKVGHWVASRRHHLSEQLIGFSDGARRIIHEASLHPIPRFEEVGAIGWGQWTEMKRSHSVRAFGELCLGALAITAFCNGAFIFRTELSAELLAAALLHDKVGNDADHDQNNYRDGNHLGCSEFRRIHGRFSFQLTLKFRSIHKVQPSF
jgi:hypothetical protein